MQAAEVPTQSFHRLCKGVLPSLLSISALFPISYSFPSGNVACLKSVGGDSSNENQSNGY